ncbi:MAG: 4Fe-4S binding protein [Fretibacterium sp.]|nr:4Fe-4S binding protein [Fretibacterium sp.]
MDKVNNKVPTNRGFARQTLPPATRRLVQLYSALLFNAHLKGFIEGEIYQGKTKFACVPGLNCYSCPGATGACPLGALQNALGSSGHRMGWYVLGIIILYGVILGRTVCGWLCPFGLIQELLHKIPTLKIKKSRFTRAFSYLKYVILAVLVVIMPLWYGLRHNIPMPGFCKYLCPAGTLEGAVGLLANPVNADMFNMLGPVFTCKFVIMLTIGLACVLCYRSFCRFICPLGALYGFFNRFNIIGVKVDESLCIRCGMCVQSCAMDVRCVGDRECIHCGECVTVCPHKAISFTLTGRGRDVRLKTSRRRTLGAVALAVLCFALLGYNIPEKKVPTGCEVGQRLADFSIKCLDGTEFHLADARGKVVFINLWATYCSPCVRELPHFDAFYRAHKNDIAVLAVHSSLTTDDPAEYIAAGNWKMPFAVDTQENLVWNIVNGSSAIPQTLVLNRRGEVVYNQVGSVTAEVLAALYEKAHQ